MKALTHDQVKQLYASCGYPFSDTLYAGNVFGIRSSQNIVDSFNDIIGIAIAEKTAGGTIQDVTTWYAGTTDPGSAFLNASMMNPEGTFCMAPGFYRDCWMLGMHNGKYEALIQAKPNIFKGWRDKNKDGKLDMSGPLFTDATGVDQHTTNFTTDAEKVGPYSAGCQVIQHHQDFLVQMLYYKDHFKNISKYISYALFTEEEYNKAFA